MPFQKGQSGNPKGKPKGTKNKPKPWVVRLQEAFGGAISDTDLEELARRAVKHAAGDTIITESQDGQSLKAKLVSDPRLFLGVGQMIQRHEEKHQDRSALPPILEGLRQELEQYGEPKE